MLTAQRVRQLLDYDPATGEFLWVRRDETSHYIVAWNKKFAGKSAGRQNPRIYREISIDNKLYYAHRLAWLYITGEWPKDQIDHIDCNKTNNRFENLREATCAENSQNSICRKRNTTGMKGVTELSVGKFGAQIAVNKKRIWLGRFHSAAEAHRAYSEAANRYHGEFARVS